MVRRDFRHYQQVKEEIHNGLSKRDYTVAQFYTQEGVCSAIAKSSCFLGLSMGAVVLNAIWIIIDADRDSGLGVSTVPKHVKVLDNLFCAFFTLELLVRFGAFQWKRNCLKDRWFCFDAALVTLMVVETWALPLYIHIVHGDGDRSAGRELVILRVAKLLRLSRIGRIAQLLHAMPEVLMLLKGIVAALRSVMVTVILLFALLLLFGVIFRTQASGDHELAEIFPSVATSMWLLLLHGTFMDSPGSLLNRVGKLSPALAATLLAFIFFSSFTVLNLLIGVLCDVVSGVAVAEKEQSAVNYLRSTLLDILECHDQNGDSAIQKDEFKLLMRNPEVHITLTRFGVDVADLISLEDLLFEDKTHITPFGDDSDDDATPALNVLLSGASGLRAGDIRLVKTGKSDPYCVCEIPGKAGTQIRTKTVLDTLDPVWNHSAILTPVDAGDSVRITVWDEDWMSEDDFLGRATLKYSQFFPGGFEGAVPLVLPGGGEHGVVHLRIQAPREKVDSRASTSTPKKPSLSFSQFLEVVLRLRGGNSASVHDVVELRSLVLSQFARLQEQLGRQGGASQPFCETTSSRRSSPCGQSVRQSAETHCHLQVPAARQAMETSFMLPGVVAADPVLARLEDICAGQRELRAAFERQAERQARLEAELQGLRGQVAELALRCNLGPAA